MSIIRDAHKYTAEEIDEQIKQIWKLGDKEAEYKRKAWNKYHREWRREKMEDPQYADNEKLKKRVYKENVRNGRIIPKTRKPQETIVLDDDTLKNFALEIKRRLEIAWGKRVYARMKASGELDAMFYNILKDPFKYDMGDFRIDVPADQHFRLSAF